MNCDADTYLLIAASTHDKRMQKVGMENLHSGEFQGVVLTAESTRIMSRSYFELKKKWVFIRKYSSKMHITSVLFVYVHLKKWKNRFSPTLDTKYIGINFEFGFYRLFVNSRRYRSYHWMIPNMEFYGVWWTR